MFKEVALTQGTQEWLDYRKTRVGASDIPIILGTGRFKNRAALLAEKLGLSTGYASKYAMLGHDIEESVRSQKEGFRSTVFEHPENPRYIASVDGFKTDARGNHHILEVKSTRDTKILEKVAALEIPPDWDDQIQWIQYVTGIESIELIVVNSITSSVVNVFHYKSPPEPTWIKTATEAADAFLADVDKGITTEIANAPLELALEGELWNLARMQLVIDRLDARMKLMKKAREDKAETILAMNTAEAIRADFFEFGYRARKGAVVYEDIPELKGVDTDRYRKEPSRFLYFDIKSPKSKKLPKQPKNKGTDT